MQFVTFTFFFMVELQNFFNAIRITFFLPITQWCSVSDVLFTGGRGVSDFSVLKILLVKN